MTFYDHFSRAHLVMSSFYWNDFPFSFCHGANRFWREVSEFWFGFYVFNSELLSGLRSYNFRFVNNLSIGLSAQLQYSLSTSHEYCIVTNTRSANDSIWANLLRASDLLESIAPNRQSHQIQKWTETVYPQCQSILSCSGMIFWQAYAGDQSQYGGFNQSQSHGVRR